MPSANQETIEDMMETAINLPSFLLVLKQLASSSLPPEAIKSLLASIHIKEECEGSTRTRNQDVMHTLKKLTENARTTDQDFETIKLLLAHISIEGSSGHQKVETEERNGNKRAADSCTDEAPSPSKKYRSDEKTESKASTDKTEDGVARKWMRRKSTRGRNSDKNGNGDRMVSATSNLDDHAGDNQATTDTASDKTKTSSLDESRKGVATCADASTNMTEVMEASTSYQVDEQNVPSTSSGVRSYSEQASKYNCDLCHASYTGRVNLDLHYRRTHKLMDPDQILFVNGKPLFTTSNMNTNGGRAQWFLDQKVKALERYEEKPSICRLCDAELGEPDLLQFHYEKDHRVKKYCNIAELFKQAQPAAHLADLPASTPRKLRKSSKGKSADKDSRQKNAQKQNDTEQTSPESNKNNFDVIVLSDDEDESDYDDTTLKTKTEKENDDGTGVNCSPELDIKITQIKSETG